MKNYVKGMITGAIAAGGLGAVAYGWGNMKNSDKKKLIKRGKRMISNLTSMDD